MASAGSLLQQVQKQIDIKMQMGEYEDCKYIKVYLKYLVEMATDSMKQGVLQLNDNNWQNFVTYLINLIEVYPLHTAIALHASQILLPFLKGALIICKQGKMKEYRQSLSKDLEYIMLTIHQNAYKCFMVHEDQPFYIQQFNSAMSKAQNSPQYLKEDPQTQTVRDLLVLLHRIVKTTENIHLRKVLNIFIETKLLTEEPELYLQEIALNWIKYKVQLYQNQSKNFLCCRVHFERFTTSELTGFVETNNQEFKDYRWPLENDSIKLHMTKTVVGFLNTNTGGIIYVGLKEDKDKMVEVKGIELSDRQKVDFLYFLHDDILKGVYPKDSDRKEAEEGAQKYEESAYFAKIKSEFTKTKSMENGYQFRINNYISVDFLDVFDGKTYLNSRGDNARLYITRIKIKIGDPRELYHVINNKNFPQTYLREDRSVKRKDIKDFYQLFYKRISGAEIPSLQSQKKDPHASCRFNPASMVRIQPNNSC